MSVVTNPASVPRFPPRRVPFAAAAVLALLFLGMALTAVAEMKVDCENDYLTGGGQILTADDNYTPLVAGPAQYWLIAADVRYPLPAWTHHIFSKFGLLPTECM